jgi:hypothetical protein
MYDLTNIPQGNISSAQIWLLGKTGVPDMYIDVYRTSTDWDEDTLTWNNRPGFGEQLELMKIKKNYRTRSIDVTDLIVDAVSSGEEGVSFALGIPSVENVQFTFHSKDRTSGYPPALQIIMEPTDLDADGLDDDFEQLIIDFDPGDAYSSLGDVLPEDDFDCDYVTNLQEFIDGSDPTDPTSPRLLGDLNGDCEVDMLDYLILRFEYGKSGESPADINDDGEVDMLDYLILRHCYGDCCQN